MKRVLTRARARAEAYLQSLTDAPVPTPSRRSTYLAVSELRRRSEQATAATSRDLTPYELSVFSQNGEDGVLDEILRRLGIANGVFVEFGAGTGTEGVCVYLADVAGWEGRFIEADAGQFQVLAAKYAMSTRVITHQAAVTPTTVESLFAQLQVPENLEVLSVDIDSHEYWIWQALNRYRPRVMVIEYNAHLGMQPLTVPLESGPHLGRHRLLRRLAGGAAHARDREGLRARPLRPQRRQRLLRPARSDPRTFPNRRRGGAALAQLLPARRTPPAGQRALGQRRRVPPALGAGAASRRRTWVVLLTPQVSQTNHIS